MRILILSGAGLSAGAGIPTFRDAGGLYTGLFEGEAPESVLSAEGYRRDPARVERFLGMLRQRVGEAAPSEVHRGCAAIEGEFVGTVHCTQNVDDLLERGGARNVVHLHGRIRVLRCLDHGHEVDIGFQRDPELRCRCGAPLRSDVVLFEELAPQYARLYDEVARLGPDDVFVVIGTHGSVVPVAPLVGAARGRKILNLLRPSEYIPESLFDRVYYQPADEAIDAIRRDLARWRSGQSA